MSQDMSDSKELMQLFKSSKYFRKMDKFDLKINILRSGSWPDLTEKCATDVPIQLKKYCGIFEEFYNNKFKDDRKLQ